MFEYKGRDFVRSNVLTAFGRGMSEVDIARTYGIKVKEVRMILNFYAKELRQKKINEKYK